MHLLNKPDHADDVTAVILGLKPLGVISAKSVDQGFREFLSSDFLLDLDFPKAGDFLGALTGKLVSDGLLAVEIVTFALDKIEETQRKEQFVFSTFKTLLSQSVCVPFV